MSNGVENMNWQLGSGCDWAGGHMGGKYRNTPSYGGSGWCHQDVCIQGFTGFILYNGRKWWYVIHLFHACQVWTSDIKRSWLKRRFHFGANRTTTVYFISDHWKEAATWGNKKVKYKSLLVMIAYGGVQVFDCGSSWRHQTKVKKKKESVKRPQCSSTSRRAWLSAKGTSTVLTTTSSPGMVVKFMTTTGQNDSTRASDIITSPSSSNQ